MEEEYKSIWHIYLIILAFFAVLIVVGFSTGFLQTSKESTQKEKCESAGGIYMDSWSDSCTFPPRENIQPASNGRELQ